LFVLVRDEVDAEWELVDARTLAAKIENTDFGVWHTAVESRFRVWLVNRTYQLVRLLKRLIFGSNV